MNTQDKLTVLARIAEAFNGSGITWAVGASLMLYLRGIAKEFNDIDLLVCEADWDGARAALAGMGTLLPGHNSAGFRTPCFLQYAIDGVDVDLMANFTILHDGIEHRFPLSKGDELTHVQVQGEDVPLQSVSLWRECYRLMGRENKLRMIDQYMANQS